MLVRRGHGQNRHGLRIGASQDGQHARCFAAGPNEDAVAGGGAYQAGEAGAHRTIVGQGAGVPGPGEDLRLFNGPLRSLGPLFGSGRRGGKQLGDEGGGVVFPVVAGA